MWFGSLEREVERLRNRLDRPSSALSPTSSPRNRFFFLKFTTNHSDVVLLLLFRSFGSALYPLPTIYSSLSLSAGYGKRLHGPYPLSGRNRGRNRGKIRWVATVACFSAAVINNNNCHGTGRLL